MSGVRQATPLQYEVELHRTKNRIVAVDIVRILAAMAVMYGHLSMFIPSGSDKPFLALLPSWFGGPYSVIFFILAGYFACRNITWKKAVVNAWWCFAPFVLWNSVAVMLRIVASPDYWSWSDLLNVRTILDVFGFGQITSIIENGDFFGGSDTANIPLWFMRDLVVLFLLSPVLYRLAKILFPCLMLLALIPPADMLFQHNQFIVFSPYSLLFFVAGCFIRTFSKEAQLRILSYYSLRIIAVYVLVVICYGFRVWEYVGYTPDKVPSLPPVLKSLLSIWVLYQIARFLEERFKDIGKLALILAPVTFLTFATHMLVFSIIRRVSPHFFTCTATTILAPIGTFAILTLIFFAMKRWCRPLLHLVAHYKLRPDDLKQ